MQVREFFSIVLVLLMCVPADARMKQTAAADKRSEATSRVAKKVMEMPEGTQIEVVLRNKDTLRGRLGRVSQESFRMECARGEKVMDREVPFDQVKLVKKPGAAAVSATSQERTVQQQVVEIPTGNLVEVRLTDKSRIRGRIGKISEEGFLLTAAKGNQVEEQKLAFSDVTSIKTIEKKDGGKKGLYILLGAAIAVGTIFLIAAILSTTSYN